MKMSKRILAMLLAAVMVLSIAPVSVMRAAAEDVTEAISDLGDALAVKAEDTSAADLADEPEAASEAEEPALEPEQTEAESSAPEPEQTETEAPATEEKQTEAEAPATEPESTEAATSSVKELVPDEATTEAIQKAARRAPLLAGPEISLGLEGFNSSNGHFEFTDGQFKILQLSDLELNATGNAISAQTERAIRDAILFYRPDLVILTGDQIYSNSTGTGDMGTLVNNIATVLRKEDPNIHFTVTFGDHEYNAGSTHAEEQNNAWKNNVAGFVDIETLSGSGTLYGDGNGYINVYDGNNVAAKVFVIDTQKNRIGGDDDTAYNTMVGWYSGAAGSTPNVVFQHQVLQEIYTSADANNTSVLKRVSSGTAHAAEYNGNYYLLNDGMSGELNEAPKASQYSTISHFNAMAEHSCLGVFFGHDHLNTFGGPVTVGGKRSTSTLAPV